ncbi:MAG TPA: alpha/beta hydrolase [Pirellulaceae bacterium]|nr:alpha/beta hydrolase [Pirellulaceae bacterium]
MDRRLLALLSVGLAFVLGCGSESSQPATAGNPASGGGQASGPEAAETHRPIIVGHEPFDPQSFQPIEDPKALSRSFEMPSAQSPRDREGNPLRTADAAALRMNPLRTLEPEAPSAAEPHPLVPRMAEPEIAPPATALPETAPPLELPESAPLAVEAAQPLAGDLPSLPAAGGAALMPPAPPPETLPYEVVQVFYGTDRRAAEPLANDWPSRLVRFLPTLCSGLLTVCMVLVASSRRKLGLWMLVFAGCGVSLGLGLQATSTTIAAIRQVGKSGRWYTTERSAGNRVELGLCEVTIPRSHISGELEAPTVLRLEVREDAARHVVLRGTQRLASPKFFELLQQRVEQSPRRELFIFVHGFNVSFEDAARRTAQMHHDLRFDGAPVFFSWPASDKFVLTYAADESNVATSAPNLKQFLLEIVQRTQARSINLIAHSMGNRALGAALREIDLELRGESRLFNQVILAAPDLDAEDFRTNIAPALRRTAKGLTLYASSRDDALLASQLLHRGPRAGDAGQGLVVIPGIDTIDVTAIDSSPWGHSYYGSSDPVLTDLKALLLQSTPAQDRTWLSPAERDGQTYWIFQPARTAASPGHPPR